MGIRLSGLPLVLAVAVVGCGKPNAYVPPPPPEVTVATPVQRTVTEYLEFTGLTQPMETVEIRARVKGFLKERHFVDGAEVKQGQLLLVIDEETFQIQLDASRTRLQEAQAALKQATVSKAREVARAQVNLSESQIQLARQEEQRVRSLFQRQIATEAEMDQAVSSLKSREAELESAKANLDQAVATYETSILACRAQVETAAIAVRNAELDLSYCRMTAPIDGRISRINVDIGNLVGDGESSVLATIVKMDPIYAYATISEADVLRTPALTQFESNTGGPATTPVPVELGLATDDDFPVAGQIDYSDPGLDAGTGTLRTRGVFPNADRSLLPGMFVRMRVPVAERRNAILVPERALGTDQSGQYLLVVASDGKVQYRPVRIGVSVDEMRVVEGQIALEDQVIVEGLLRARPGATVTPKLETPTIPVAATTAVSGRR
ncbi:efflux RND transporter periplasmic adaptor subunit [Planctellipticum variicoloris]|uniref:efflux RND transporter periplasmic adaptor subunit n=1 Tax=Planctellipticum variicoloris TaxID=3064265 RepID=UPI003013219F|nr:efflux RND transporter periplasmic adaptor subunit [Planctomycetaceae bacterium SH412]